MNVLLLTKVPSSWADTPTASQTNSINFGLTRDSNHAQFLAAQPSNPNQASLTTREQDWLDWLRKANERTITTKQAAEKMGVTERWVRKLLIELT